MQLGSTDAKISYSLYLTKNATAATMFAPCRAALDDGWSEGRQTWLDVTLFPSIPEKGRRARRCPAAYLSRSDNHDDLWRHGMMPASPSDRLLSARDHVTLVTAVQRKCFQPSFRVLLVPGAA